MITGWINTNPANRAEQASATIDATSSRPSDLYFATFTMASPNEISEQRGKSTTTTIEISSQPPVKSSAALKQTKIKTKTLTAAIACLKFFWICLFLFFFDIHFKITNISLMVKCEQNPLNRTW